MFVNELRAKRIFICAFDTKDFNGTNHMPVRNATIEEKIHTLELRTNEWTTEFQLALWCSLLQKNRDTYLFFWWLKYFGMG